MENNNFTLSKFQNVVKGDLDFNLQIDLSNNYKLIQDDEFSKIISLSELYDEEREESDKYFINGKIDILSYLYRVPQIYDDITFFFDETKKQDIDFLDRFEIYLCYFNRLVDATNKTIEFNQVVDNQVYTKEYKTLTTLNDVIVTPYSFSTNIYKEPLLYYYFSKAIDLKDMRDGYFRPITELSVYIKIKPFAGEYLANTFDNIGNTFSQEDTQTNLPLNSTIIGEQVTIDIENFEEVLFANKIQKFNTKPIKIYSNLYKTDYLLLPSKPKKSIKMFYNPFNKIKLRDFSTYTENALVNEVSNIPDYAFIKNNQNYWKDIEFKSSMNYPFTDGNHYVFKEITFATQLDLSNGDTSSFFGKFAYTKKKIGTKLTDDKIIIC